MLGAAGVKGPEQASYYTKLARAYDADYYAGGANLATEWMGGGATDLGLAGPVGIGELGEVLLGHDPRSGEQLGRAFVESSASDRGSSARAWDLTFSVPKEVSATWAAARLESRLEVARAIEESVLASAREIVAEIEQTYATTRMGPAGRQVWTKVNGVTAATFLQPDSRAQDPQLHIHILVSTKVRRPDGRWGTLHPSLLLKHKEALDRLGRACLGAELRNRLGIPVDGEARIPGVPGELCRALSTRREMVVQGYAARLDEFRESEGREPSRLEAWRLRQLATTESRRTKGTGGATRAVLDRAQDVFDELGLDRDQLLDGLLAHVYSNERPEPRVAAEKALAGLSDRQSTWHRQDVAREVARLVPETWAASAADVRAFVSEATEASMKSCILLEPGRGPRPYAGAEPTTTLPPHALTCSTRELIETADRLSAWAAAGTKGLPCHSARMRAIAAGADANQADAAAVVAGRAAVVLVVGPPGSGKTTVIEAGVAQLRQDGRPVVLAAVSHRARQELAASTGEHALTVRALRYRVDQGLLELPTGTTLVLDEASTLSTPDMTWIADLAQRGGHRVVMIGDPSQLSAVGQGGVFADLVAENPKAPVLLERLWRFQDQEEAKAALALWRGEAGALSWYADHDRLVPVPSGFDGQIAAVADLWEKARSQGEVEVFADTNEQTFAANLAIQKQRIANCEVVPTEFVAREMHGEDIHVGDVVALRGTDEDQRVTTDAGERVFNRDRGTVIEVTSDACVVVDFGAQRGNATLPADQVRERVELAYAITCHGGQGMTVGGAAMPGTGLYWRSEAGDSRALLVGMTRGRDANLVIGRGESVDHLHAKLVGQLGKDRADVSPRAALRSNAHGATHAQFADLGGHRGSLARAWAERDSLAQLLADARRAEVAKAPGLRSLRQGVDRCKQALTSSELQLRRLEGVLDGHSKLRRRQVQGKSQAHLARARAQVASDRQQLKSARLALRAGEDAGRTCTWPDAHSPQLARLAVLEGRIRRQSAATGRELSHSPPPYLIAELGEPTTNNDRSWQQAASEIESYRARWGIEDDREALPRLGGASEAHRQAVHDQLVDLGYSAGIEAMTRG